MWAFMTTGTTHFLKNVAESHPDKEFHFMKNGTATLIYYEAEKKKSIFVSGRTYRIIHHNGSVHPTGFVVMHHVPVAEDEMPHFMDRTGRQLSTLHQVDGILASRLLQEHKTNKFVIYTQWKTEHDFNNWQKTEDKNELNFTKTTRLPAYFMERPFTNQYYMLKEEDE